MFLPVSPFLVSLLPTNLLGRCLLAFSRFLFGIPVVVGEPHQIQGGDSEAAEETESDVIGSARSSHCSLLCYSEFQITPIRFDL
jgi:hypothetical protein